MNFLDYFNDTGFRIALRLSGMRDLKSYDKT